MGLFDNIKQATSAQETEDRVGGSFKPLESGVYKAKIKQMYAKPAQSGALGVTVEFEVYPEGSDPRKLTETHYVTNKNGENFYVDKNGNQQYLMGFNQVNDLCLGLTGKTLFELNQEGKIEDKNVKIYNYNTKKDEIELLPTFVPLLEKDLALGLIKRRENKREKVGNDYVNSAKDRVFNVTDKVFVLKDNLPFTVKEVKAGLNEPKFVHEWLERWKDQLDDRYEEVAGSAGSTAPVSALNLG